MFMHSGLEGIDVLCAEIPELPDEISSVRYNSFASEFVLCPFHHFIWDLVHIFSSVRLRSDALGKCYDLVYYSEHRKVFAHDVVDIQES